MRFTLLDRIVDLDPGVKITGLKALTMAEEYLGDHFPRFPVMPGVLMLQAMTDAGAWLVRVTEDFAHSMVSLREANNLRYGQFVEPGQTLMVEAEIVKSDETETRLKARGTVDGQVTVSARLVLARYNLADKHSIYEDTDEAIRQEARRMFSLLYRPPMGVRETPAS